MIRSRLALWLGIILFPPAGIILLWVRGNMRVWTRVAGTLGICIVAIFELFYVYGMRVEWNGNMQVQKISFHSRARHYKELEENRQQQRAQAAPLLTAPVASAPAAVTETVSEKLNPSLTGRTSAAQTGRASTRRRRSTSPGPQQVCRDFGNSRWVADMHRSR